jgi:PAS domain S-box-containing protein
MSVPSGERGDMLQLILDHAGEGISVFDADMRLRLHNQRFLDCTGLPPERAKPGVALIDLLRLMAAAGEFGPFDDAAAREADCQRRLADLRDGPPGLSQRLRPNGQTLELRRTRTPDGGFVMLYADISLHRAAEASLLQQQRMLQLVQQTTAQGFWFIDTELRTVDANPAMCRMLGLEREALLGRSIFDFVDATQAEIFRRHAALSAQGVASGYEIRLRRADGASIDCFNNATPIFDADGRRHGSLGLFTDVTPLKQAKNQLQLTTELLAQKSQVLEVTLDSLAQGVLSVDANGQINAWNRRFLELLEVPEEFMARRPGFLELCRWQIDQGLLPPQPLYWPAITFTYQRTRRDGTIVEVQTHVADDGGIVRTYTDITTRQQAETALRTAKDEAERANRAKSEFLSRMSHELRTPLNAVLGFAQLLQTEADEPLSPRQAARVQEMLRGGHHLLRLINDVLDLSRIEAGALQLDLEPVDLADLVGDCIRLVAPAASDRQVTLHVQPGAPDRQHVQADPTRLRQVLLNLLSNAVKYNRPGGLVEVSWTPEPERASLCLAVADTGPGLSAEQQSRLFQAFERLDARHSPVEGAGIGLALSRWLVTLMQGEIGVDSTPGQGSRFWVRLAEAPRPQPAPARSEPAGPARRPEPEPHHDTVLYIEDNTVNQLLMEGMLAQRPGVRLLTAGLPETGLSMALQAQPALVLLDIQLPGMDGYAVLKHLRADPRTAHIPVIAVSANAMPDDLRLAREAGFDDYVTKPVDLRALLAAVARVLDR